MRSKLPGIAGLGMALLLGVGFGTWSQADAAEVFGDAAGKRYHTADCPEKGRIKPRDLKPFEAEAEAGAKGYYPCPVCIPPTVREPLPERTSRKLSQPVSRARVYLGDLAQGTYHYPWCPRVKDRPSADLKRFASVERAVLEGFVRCGECNPPTAVAKIGRVSPARTPTPLPQPGQDGLPPAEQE